MVTSFREVWRGLVLYDVRRSSSSAASIFTGTVDECREFITITAEKDALVRRGLSHHPAQHPQKGESGGRRARWRGDKAELAIAAAEVEKKPSEVCDEAEAEPSQSEVIAS